MKKILYTIAILAGAACIAACSKDEVSGTAKQQVTFFGVIDEGLKASLTNKEGGGYTTVWDEGDIITVNGVEFSLVDKATGKFSGNIDIPAGSGSFPVKYTPYEYTDQPAFTGIVGSKLPMNSTISYSDGKFTQETISFQATGGMLAFLAKTGKGKDVYITKITVENGGVTYSAACDNVDVNKNNATRIYIALPAATYAAGTIINLWSGSPDPGFTKEFTLELTSNIVIGAGIIFNASHTFTNK